MAISDHPRHRSERRRTGANRMVPARPLTPDTNNDDHRDDVSDDVTDEALLARLAAGDDRAITHLYERYAPEILRVATRTLDRSAAEEITQDVMLAVWRSAATFDQEMGRAHAWILRIAQRRVINELRRRSRRPIIAAGTDSAALDRQIDGRPQPEDTVWSALHDATLHDAIDTLPAPQRDAVRLAFLEQFTHQQISQLLDVPLGTTKTRIRAALRSLQGHRAVAALVVTAIALIVTSSATLHVIGTQRRDGQLHDRAVRMLASSDTTSRRLEPVGAPVHPDTHAAYRTRPGSSIAVLTLTDFAELPSGLRYQLWARRRSQWQPLATVRPDSAGHALLIIERHIVSDPDELRVTLESDHPGSQPSTRIFVAWPARPPSNTPTSNAPPSKTR